MISSKSLSLDWIQSRVHKFQGSDPIIIEKVIRALVLLEALKSLNLDFIFKGGTALMLMIQEPKRFSIDIDIIVENKDQNIEDVLNNIIEVTDFIGWEEQKRTPKSKIDKRHFELQYTPQTQMKGEVNYILLDIVFEANPYTETQNIDVSHFLVLEEGSPIQVIVPTLSAILGDKLTAYGPQTTGVPLEKPMEVMKQIYDIASIFNRLETLGGVKESFIKVSERELEYRGFKTNEFQIIIDDIINSSHNFCVYGKLDLATFKIMQTGVSKLDNFIYGDKFREPQAQISLAKASYIAKQIESNLTNIDKFDKTVDMTSWVINDHSYSRLNKLKKHNLEAFHYWHKTLET